MADKKKCLICEGDYEPFKGDGGRCDGCRALINEGDRLEKAEAKIATLEADNERLARLADSTIEANSAAHGAESRTERAEADVARLKTRATRMRNAAFTNRENMRANRQWKEQESERARNWENICTELLADVARLRATLGKIAKVRVFINGMVFDPCPDRLCFACDTKEVAAKALDRLDAEGVDK